MTKKCTHCGMGKANLPLTETMEQVSLISAECEAMRQHKIICRLIWAVVLLTVLLFGSNCAWWLYESQFENVVETCDVEQNDNCNCVIKGGEVCDSAPSYQIYSEIQTRENRKKKKETR